MAARTVWPVVGLGMAGRAAHDVVDLGGLSAEWWFTGLVAPVALAAWYHATRGRAAWSGLATWLALMVFGAVTSVLPLPIWPFAPAQSALHYAMHAMWFLGLVPLAVWLHRERAATKHGPAGTRSGDQDPR